MPIATDKLRRAFIAQMDRTGRPITYIGQTNTRGPGRQLFEMANSQKVLLRTNNQRAVMSVAVGIDPEDRLPFETEDFLGIAIPGETAESVACYLVPSAVAARAMKDAHRQWQEFHRDSEADTRVLKFSEGPRDSIAHGYAERWSQYSLGEISLAELDSNATDANTRTPVHVSALNDVISESRRRIAAAAQRPESAVTITIEY